VSEFILRPLTVALTRLREVGVPEGLVSQLFSQVCYTIAAVVFNHVLGHREDCAVERGFQVKMELSKLRDWLTKNNLRDALAQLKPLAEIATVFITDKSQLADPAIFAAVCPSLTPAQLRRVLAAFPETPAGVVTKLKSQAPAGDTGELDEAFMQRLSYDFLDIHTSAAALPPPH
jgi:myosin heavy subunit